MSAPPPTTPIPPRRTTIFRAGLLSLAALQIVDGLYALAAPRSFYDDFPLGRGWVAALPDYSEHLVRDVGGLFLATGILLVAAGVWLERRLVAVALVSFLAFSLPHTIFHLFNLEPYDTADALANALGLIATVVIPIGLLVALRAPAAAPRPAAAAPAGSNGRIPGVPESTRNPLIRYAYRESRKQGGGAVADPVRLFAHHPKLLAGYGTFELATESAARVPERIKHLASLRAAMLCGCEWCLDYASAISTAKNVSEDDLRALPAYADSERFGPVEKLVLDYASAMSRTPVEVPDELFERLRAHFDEAQLVELTSVIALENYRARFNWAFGLAGQGFAEGAHCVRPATDPPAPRAGPGGPGAG